MRILLLARLDQAKSYFRGDEGTADVPELPPQQGHHFWVKALRDQGHDVEVFRYTDSASLPPAWAFRIAEGIKGITELGYKAIREVRQLIPPSLDPDYRRRNDRIVDRALEFEPELVLVIGGYHQLSPETFETIRRRCDPIIVGASGTGPHDYGTKEERYIAPRFYDVMFVNDEHRMHAWRSIGVNAEVLPVSSSPVEFASQYLKDDSEYDAEISFIGQPYPRRVQYLEALTDFDLALYGPGWSDTELAEYHRGEAWGGNMFKAIYNSDISINIHHRTMLTGGNMKQFEIPAAQTLQIADVCPNEWFTDGEEIVLVDTPEDLREAVAHYLDTPEERERIARAGHERAAAEHTYSHRMARLVELAKSGAGRADGVVDRKYLDDGGRLV
ncbi:CgeB family protein [Halobacterium hubeiense]|uniref:CgeB family protein n=1 Tax=Halobacterium hubeiense TaxID=1407499 RepID=UPI003C73854E